MTEQINKACENVLEQIKPVLTKEEYENVIEGHIMSYDIETSRLLFVTYSDVDKVQYIKKSTENNRLIEISFNKFGKPLTLTAVNLKNYAKE